MAGSTADGTTYQQYSQHVVLCSPKLQWAWNQYHVNKQEVSVSHSGTEGGDNSPWSWFASLFLKEWYFNYIVWVNQLFNSIGALFTFLEFLHCYQIPVTSKQFAIVFDAIPSAVCMLLNSNTSASALDAPFVDVTDSPVEKCFNSSSCKNNHNIHALSQSNVVSAGRVNNLCWEKV